MPISIDESTSPVKSWSLDIVATSTGIDLPASSVLFGADRYDIPAMTIPCVYSDDARYRLALCRGQTGPAIVLVEDDAMPAGYVEIISPVRWRFASPTDTCASVDVHVVRRVLVDRLDDDGNPIPRDEPTVHAVSPVPVLPDASPTGERVMGRRRRARIRDLRQQLVTLREAGTTVPLMTAAQKALVTEFVGLTGEPAPLAVP